MALSLLFFQERSLGLGEFSMGKTTAIQSCDSMAFWFRDIPGPRLMVVGTLSTQAMGHFRMLCPDVPTASIPTDVPMAGHVPQADLAP